MIFLNPIAWIGLLALGLPLVIHLLGRRSARVQPFPTLRFVTPSVLQLMRRTRLTDPLLLLVRMGIVASAVTALAQPWLRTSGRAGRQERATARVVLLDTSASARAGLAQARAQAAELIEQSQSALLVETGAPGGELPGAAHWLMSRPGRREIIVLSDFQRGVIDDAQLRGVPPSIGLGFRRMAMTTRPPAGMERVRITLSDVGTSAEWREGAPAQYQPLIMADERDRAAAQAALEAAGTLASATARTGDVAVAFPGYTPAHEGVPRAAWMADVAAALAADTTIARLASATIEGGTRLIVHTRAQPGTLASAELFLNVLRATAHATELEELEPVAWPDSVLRRWQRPAGAVAGGGQQTDARWFWLLALLLIGVESMLRGSRRAV